MSDSSWTRLPLLCPVCRAPIVAGPAGASCGPCGVEYPAANGILRLVRGREGAPGYDPHFFVTLERVEGRHFWFVERREVVLDALRRTVPDLGRRRLFDIGCGSGGLLEFLAGRGVTLAGACDAYRESLEIVRRRVEAPLLLVDEGRLPPIGPGHDLLALFDVLEHVDDDRGMLRFLNSALAPGGVLVLTLPAHPFLFDERDERARHRRRYRRRDLREKLEEAGFEVRLLSHFMAPLVPLLLLLRFGRWLRGGWGGGRGEPHDSEFRVVPGLNGLLRAVLVVERRLIRLRPLPFGSSIVAVAAREDCRP